MITIGIDMSLRSPAIAVLNTYKWSLFCFAQRNTDVGKNWVSKNGNVALTVLPKIPSTDNSDVVRYDFVIRYIMSIIGQISNNTPGKYKQEISILIENYAFVPSKIAGSTFKLHELVGILRYELHRNKFNQVLFVPPTRWKKQISGNGRMTKQETVEYVHSNGPSVDLWSIFGIKKNIKSVPSPIQDVADAIGIVLGHTKNIITQPQIT